MKYIVYKTTNIVNGKIYIGVHKVRNEKKDTYIGCGLKKTTHKFNRKYKFHCAVEKYGYENFKRETLFEYPGTALGEKLAYLKEAELVNEEFLKRPDVYNMILGGKLYKQFSKKICQYDLDGNFIRIWDSIENAECELNLTAIQQAIAGNSRYCGKWQWRIYKGNTDNITSTTIKEKTVYQFNLQGTLIKVWKSVVEASKSFNNPKSARVAISNCCCNKTHQSFGYYWSYKCKFESKKNNHLAAVAKYNDDGEFLESYSSIKEAAVANNIKTTPNIIAAIKGSQKRCGGFRWRYFYGNTQNIPPLTKD